MMSKEMPSSFRPSCKAQRSVITDASQEPPTKKKVEGCSSILEDMCVCVSLYRRMASVFLLVFL